MISLLEDYIQALALGQQSPRSIRLTGLHLARVVLFFQDHFQLGSAAPEHVRPADVRYLRTFLRLEGLSPGTASQVLGALGQWFAWMHAAGHIHNNPLPKMTTLPCAAPGAGRSGPGRSIQEDTCHARRRSPLR